MSVQNLKTSEQSYAMFVVFVRFSEVSWDSYGARSTMQSQRAYFLFVSNCFMGGFFLLISDVHLNIITSDLSRPGI